MRLQCQQLDLLFVSTSDIDEHSVTLLACIQCSPELTINVVYWSWLGSALFFTLAGKAPKPDHNKARLSP